MSDYISNWIDALKELGFSKEIKESEECYFVNPSLPGLLWIRLPVHLIGDNDTPVLYR